MRSNPHTVLQAFIASLFLWSLVFPSTAESFSGARAGLSGSWFDQSRNGEGFILEFGEITGQAGEDRQPVATVYWFTYEDDQPIWLVGASHIDEADFLFESTIELEMLTVSGTGFGMQFDSSELSRQIRGVLEIEFYDCQAANLIWTPADGNEGLGSRTLNYSLNRITQQLEGVTCESQPTVTESKVGPVLNGLQGALTGSWFSPARDGEGFVLEFAKNGDNRFATVYWFTHRDGKPYWLIGAKEYAENDLSIEFDLLEFSGTGFGSSFNSSTIVNNEWGSLRFSLVACDQAVVTWRSNNENSGDYALKRITLGLEDVACSSYRELWDREKEQIWVGAELEGQVTYCLNRSERWDWPITNFDLNGDQINDLLLPISCYQGPDPETRKHNRALKSAWIMLCSGEAGHYNCTQDLFGTPVIDASGPDSDGGNPYTHVLATPADLNGDGYPDFWYPLNRDDGRQGLNLDDAEDRKKLEEFCGPPPEPEWTWACTYSAVQTVILSSIVDQKLKYEVIQIPWGSITTQAMGAFPNHLGGYDLLAFNYGPWRAARILPNNKIEDVTEEYRSYRNVDVALMTQPYMHNFDHEGQHYLAVAEVSPAVVEDPEAGDWIHPLEPGYRGFTLWKWEPGIGFSLSDYYLPKEEDRFTYTEGQGQMTREVPGAYIRGIPVFNPTWHFFEVAELNPSEGPLLIVGQEGYTTVGRYFKNKPDPEMVYRMSLEPPEGYENRLFPLVPLQAFFIKDGKLIEREAPVVHGEITWFVPGFKFADLTGDGLMDMYGTTGWSRIGQVFLNDGHGSLRKVKVGHVWPEVDISDFQGGWFGHIFDLGRAPYLDMFYWGGGITETPSWFPQSFKYEIPPVGIIPAIRPITDLPFHTAEMIQSDLDACMEKKVWVQTCLIN